MFFPQGIEQMIKISGGLAIPENELTFKATRSSGPGGQNVNKVSTRVILQFDVVNSLSLQPEQKRLILRRLANRINKDGVLRVASQHYRSQGANRAAAVERFGELMREALRRVPPRQRTQISRAAKQRRLVEKRHRSRLKQSRSKRAFLED